ncbi:four-carbon acid sugar kinase family protein [Niabella insulamsoli]|uniref:four-carbon acid sugar kinase family protein n=1 Tax=Niabella insulamsoli TaxID=3144874 RepID=UPI0031FD5D01
MIIVIADDFTGAAEMAGISLGYGLQVALCLNKLVASDADVLILSAETRSMPKEQAVATMKEITLAARALGPAFVYKKIDSVLRGHVAAEVEAQLEVLGLKKALLLPANPSMGRTIVNGQYFVDGIALSNTGFAKDPEFAIRSSEVREIIQRPEAAVLRAADDLKDGLNIGETNSFGDVERWAANMPDRCLPAGSGDFFEALLNQRFKKKQNQDKPRLQKPHIYISGTTYQQSRDRMQRTVAGAAALITANMLQRDDFSNWFDRASGMLESRQRLIIAFDDNIDTTLFDAAALRRLMAGWMKRALENWAVKELLIEGGATAAALFEALGQTCFEAVYEWGRGVVRMKAGELMVTVKPGSYQLPDALMEFYQL